MNIRQPASQRTPLGVAYIVPRLRRLTTDLTLHRNLPVFRICINDSTIIGPDGRADMKTDSAAGQTLRDMFTSGTLWLEKSAPDINAINVFPVPDGDTGTNMALTMKFALEEAELLGPDDHASSVAKSLARGALMGARGNSGIIFSQFSRGLAKGLEGKTRCDGSDLARALAEVEVVYGGQPHYDYIISLE